MNSDQQEDKLLVNKERIIEQLKVKSAAKQKAYDNTLQGFKLLKDTIRDIVLEFNSEIDKEDSRIRLDYKTKGDFESELKVAGDLLIFSMHTNVFEFSRDQGIWKLQYLKNEPLASYCGIISIYNFLNDSFKYNRLDDLGYLVARIFINKNNHFFVEGKRHDGFMYNAFGQNTVDENAIRKIVETTISYSIDFDLLVPPYDSVKIASVAQMHDQIQAARLKTGKRLGFQFNSDDVGKE